VVIQITSYCTIKQAHVGWLVGQFLLTDFGPYGIVYINVCVVIALTIIMLVKEFGPLRIVFMTMCV
jgi:hypothetical protein